MVVYAVAVPSSEPENLVSSDRPGAETGGLGLILAAAHHAWRGRATAALAEQGYGDLRLPDVQLLRLIDGGVATVGDLASLFGVSKQAMSKLVDGLAVRGYLTRRSDPADRRRTVLVPTTRARGALGAVNERRQADRRRLVELLE